MLRGTYLSLDLHEIIVYCHAKVEVMAIAVVMTGIYNGCNSNSGSSSSSGGGGGVLEVVVMVTLRIFWRW